MEHGGPLKGNGYRRGVQVLTIFLKPGGQRLLSPFAGCLERLIVVSKQQRTLSR